MRILHYFLGFPPYRTGGLTKYSFDLMNTQAKQGHKVMALWPGKMELLSKRVKIKKSNNVNDIENYELINPLPVSLDEGINSIDDYMKECKPDVYQSFLKGLKPDVIHVHTLMGLHQEFIKATKELHIRTVFTTHDYFGLCPKVTLYRYGRLCVNDHDCKDCIQCNINALSLNKIQIMQSPLYRGVKNSALVKQLRKKHRNNFFSNEEIPALPENYDISAMSAGYRKLRSYYIDMLKSIDLIHFNSTVAETVYNRYFTPKLSKVLTITHENIRDNRTKNRWKPNGKLRISCLAPAKPFKGFNILRGALDEIWDSGNHDFELKLFSPVENPAPYMKVQEDGFDISQLEDIFENTDILVAPSVWYETFGFTVLEAISYGVPVIVSNHVGAKDIVGCGGIVIEAGSQFELKDAITSLSSEKIQILRSNIQKTVDIKTWEQFVKENYELYQLALNVPILM